MKTDNDSLRDKLKAADVLDEFQELMFAHEMHYEELLEQLEKWGISSSMGALSRFKASHIGPWSMERAKNEERDFLEKNGADLDEATRRMIASRIFQAAANPNTTTKDVLRMKDLEVSMAKLRHDSVRLEQAERKLSLLEQKLGSAKEAMESEQLTPEEKVAQWKQIFGR